MRTILSLAIQPLSIFWVLVCLALIFRFRHKAAAVKKLLIAALIWLVLVSTATLPDLLIRPLESRYKPLKELPVFKDKAVVNIMVLGAGHTSDPNLSPNNQLASNALKRLVEGVRIHQLIPYSKLILSGGLGTETESQASVMKKTAIILGVNPKDIHLLSTTLNTADEASQYKNKLSNQQQLILVTDAYHMPRAIMHFEKQGLKPISAPVNFLYKKGRNIEYSKWLPKANNIWKIEIAVHEYAGMLWVWVSS